MPSDYHRLLHDSKGPVHVWLPDSRSSLDLCVFVHGFDLKGKANPWYVDSVVDDFGLNGVLRKSYLRNTAFCAIESKIGSGKPIHWTSLKDLDSFLDQNGISVLGDVHAIGHSGAYANIAMWLDNETLTHVTLLDATYGKMSAYAEWAKGDDRYLDICVSKGGRTHKNAWAILKEMDGYYTWNQIPNVDEAHRMSDVLYCPQHRSHMSWVVGGGVLPVFITRGQHIRDMYADNISC